MPPDFVTLQDAVRSSFPVQSTRVVAVREQGDAAVALFDTRPGAQPYLYEVHFDRKSGGWVEGSSSNGPGWHRFALADPLGVETLWGEAPRGADLVRAERTGVVVEEPVADGIYLLVWWNVTERLAEVKAFRVNGAWVRPSTFWEEALTQWKAWLRGRGS